MNNINNLIAVTHPTVACLVSTLAKRGADMSFLIIYSYLDPL